MIQTTTKLTDFFAALLTLCIVVIHTKNLETQDDVCKQEFKNAILRHHNVYRDVHGVPNIFWDEPAAEFTQYWCDYLEKNSKFEHSNEPNLGENVYWSRTNGKYRECAAPRKTKNAVQKLYKEIKFYDYEYDDPKFSKKSAHFSQVMWKSSTGVECGYVFTEKLFYVCCNYSPPGNYRRWFKHNVLPLVPETQ